MSTPPAERHGYVRAPRPPLGNTVVGRFDLGWDMFTDDTEYVPELVWPRSTRTFDIMRTDSQLSGLFRATTLPIRRYKFMIDENGADEEIVQHVATDLNLDIVGQDPRPKRRMKGRFSFQQHLFEALLSGIYGFGFFEQIGTIEADGKWHLRKLMQIPPLTIDRIDVAEDGGLVAVKQIQSRGSQLSQPLPLEVDRLVAYPMDMEGGRWIGRSWFRNCYRNWLIKDRLMRVDAINHERAGGVPIAEAPPGATPQEKAALGRMAQSFKVGEDSGGSVPSGTKFELHKVGSGTDVVGSMKYHDESMAREFLHMFVQLGQTETGSRALGDSFVEYAFIAQKAVAQWFVDIFNEHVIEDLVDWNYGEDVEQVPLLKYVIEGQDEYMSVAELAEAVDKGLITVDDELENVIRKRYHFPQLTKSRAEIKQEEVPPEPPADPAASPNGQPVVQPA